MQIPKSLKLMGLSIKVSEDPMLKSNYGCVGMVNYDREAITLQKNTTATPVSRQALEQTYLHELVHYIFYLSEEDGDDPPLSKRECLVDRVASLLHQALNSAKGGFMTHFLGQPMDFWMEIQKKLDMLDDPKLVERLILENRRLRGKVDYIKRRVNEFKQVVQEDI